MSYVPECLLLYLRLSALFHKARNALTSICVQASESLNNAVYITIAHILAYLEFALHAVYLNLYQGDCLLQ